MTQQELAALVEILNRAPVSAAERLWLQMLITRFEREIKENDKPHQAQPV